MKNSKNNFLIYIIVAFIAIPVIFIALQFYFSNSRRPIETNWNKVKSTMLVNHDIERIIVVNDKVANIYIKKDSLEKYDQEFKGSFNNPPENGPQFTFNIGSIENFEKNLREAQKNETEKILPEYKEERNWPGEILWTGGYAVLAIFILIAYFIPTYIANGKENFWPIFLINLLTGWTVLGWIGTLFWAINSKKVQLNHTYICSKCNYKYEIDQQVKLFVCPNCKEKNIISEDQSK